MGLLLVGDSKPPRELVTGPQNTQRTTLEFALKTFREIAAALNVNVGTAHRWHRKGMPLEIEAAKAWREAHAGVRVKPDATAQSEPDDDSFSIWRTRRERATALQAEAILAHQGGTLISVLEIRAAFAKHVLAAKAVLLNMGPRLASALAAENDAATIEALITAEVVRALAELAASPLAEAPSRP